MSQQSLPGTLCVLQRSEAPCTSNQLYFHVDGLPDVVFCAYAVDGGSIIVKQAPSGLQPFQTSAVPVNQTCANQPEAATAATAAAHISHFQTVLLVNDTSSHIEEPIRRLVWGGGRYHLLAAASGQDISIISLAPFMQSLLAAHLHQQQQQLHVSTAQQYTTQQQVGLQLHKHSQQQILQTPSALDTAKAVGDHSGPASQQQQQQPQQAQKQGLQDASRHAVPLRGRQQPQQQQQLLYHPSSAAVRVPCYHTTAPLLGMQWTYDAAGLLVSDAGGNIVMLEVTQKLTQQQQQDQSAALPNSTQQQQQQQQRLIVREVWRAHADAAHNMIAAGAAPTRPSATVCSDHAQRVIVWWPSRNPARSKPQRSKASGLGLGSGQSGALDNPKAAAMQDPDQQQAAAAAVDYAVGAEVIRHPVAAVHIQWSPPLFTGQRNASSSSSIAGAGSSGGLHGGAAAATAPAAAAGSASSGGVPGSLAAAKGGAAAAAGVADAAGSPRGSSVGLVGGSSSSSSSAASSLPLKAAAAAAGARENNSSSGGSSSSSDGQPALMTVGADGIIRIFVEVVMSDVITPAIPAAAPSGSSTAAAAAPARPQRSDQPPQQQQQVPAAATMSQFCLTLVIEPPGLGPQALGPRAKPGFTACWAKPLVPDPGQDRSNMLWLIGSYIGPSLTGAQTSLAAALSGMEAAAAIQAGLGYSSSSSRNVIQNPNNTDQAREGVSYEDHVFLWGIDGLAGVVLSGIAQNAIMSNKITQPKAWCWGKDTKKLTWQQPLLLLHHAAAAAAAAGPSRGSDQGLDRVGLLHHSLDVWVVESNAGPLLSVMQQFHIPNNMLPGSSGSSSSYSEGRCYQVTPLTGYNESGQPSSAVAVGIKNSSVVTGRSEVWIQISVHSAADLAAAVSSRGALAIWSLSPIALLPLQQQQQQLPPSWQQCLSCCWITFGGSTAAASASAAGVAGLPLLLAVAGSHGVDVCLVELSNPQQQQQQQRCGQSGVYVTCVHVVAHLDLPSSTQSMKQLLEVSALLPAAALETGHDSNAVDLQQQQQQQKPFAMQTVLLGLGCTTSTAAAADQQQQQRPRLGERVTHDDGVLAQDSWVAWTMQIVFDDPAAAAAARSTPSSWELLASQPSITSASDALASAAAAGSSTSDEQQRSAISCVHCPSPASPFLMTGNASGLIAFWQVTAAAAAGISSSSSSRSDLRSGPRVDLIQCSSSEVAGVDFGGICVAVALCTSAGYAAAAVTCGQTELEDAVFILCAEGATHSASTSSSSSSSSSRRSRRSKSAAAAGSSSSNDVFVVDCLLALDDCASSVCWCDTAGLSPLLAVGYASGLMELYNRDHSGQWNTLAVYQSGSSINIIAANQLGLPLVVTGSQLLLLSNLAAAAAAATDGISRTSQTWSNLGQIGDASRSKLSQQPYRLQPLVIPGGPAQGALITHPDQHVSTHAAAAAAAGSSSLPLYHPEVLALLIGQGNFAAAARILRYVMILLRNMRGEAAAEDEQLAATAAAAVVPLDALLPAAAAGKEEGDESLKVIQRAIACCCAFRNAVTAAVLGNNLAAAAGDGGGFSSAARQQQQQQQQQQQSATTCMAPATPDPHQPAANKPAAAAVSSSAFDTGILDMSAFGGFGFDDATADDDWDSPAQPLAAAAVPTNEPIQQQQQQRPQYGSGAAGSALDTGMLDMSAFGGFGFGSSNADHDDWDQPAAAAAAAEHQAPNNSNARPAAGAGSSSGTAANALETGMLDMSAFGGFGHEEAATDGADWDTPPPAAAEQRTSGNAHQQQQQQPTAAATQPGSSKAAAAQSDSNAAIIRGLDPHLLAQTSVLFPKPAAAAAAKPRMVGAGAAAAAAAAARQQLLSRGEVKELHRLLEVAITKVHSSGSSSSSATSAAYYSRLLGAAGAADSSSSGGGSSSSRQKDDAISSVAAAARQQQQQQGDARILRLLGLNPQEAQQICHISAALCTGTFLGSEGAESDKSDDNITTINTTGLGIASAAALAARWASFTADSMGDSLHSQSFSRSGTVSNKNDSSSNAAAVHLPLATLRANDNAYGNALWEALDPAGRIFAVNAHLALLQITAAAAAGSSAAAAADSPAGAKQDRDQRFAAAVTRLFQPVSVSRSNASSGRGAALLAHYPAAPLPPQQQQVLAGSRAVPPLSTGRVQQLQQQGLGALAGSRDPNVLGRQSSGSGRNNSSRGLAAVAMRSSMSIASMLSFSSLKDPIGGNSSDSAAAAAKAAGSSSWATFVGLMQGLTPLHCLWAAASSSQQALLDVLLPLVPANIDQHLTAVAAAAAAAGSSSGPATANSGAFNQTGQQQQHQQTISWAKLRALGVGFWLTDPVVLRSTCETLAKAQYAATKDPHEAALMYCALGKKAVLQGLFRSTGNQKVADFLARDFSTSEGAAAASKNAFHLLGQHRYQLAAAFFILAGSGWDAVSVLAREAAEPQLALIVARLMESNPSSAAAAAGGTGGVLQRRLMNEELLLLAEADPDPAAAALAAWISSSDGSSAVNILLTRLTAGSHGTDLINLAVQPVAVPDQGPAAAAARSQQQQQSSKVVSHHQISPSILAQLPQYLHWVLACGLQQLAGRSVTGSVIPALHNLAMRVARSAEMAGMPWAAAEALAVAEKITDPCNTCDQILGSVLGLMWHARLAASILALQLVPGSNASDDLAMHDGDSSTADHDLVLPAAAAAAAAVQGDMQNWEAIVRDHLPLLEQLQLQADPAPVAAALSRHAAAFIPVTSLPAAAPGSSWCELPVAAAAAGSSAGSTAAVSGITAAAAAAAPDTVLALCLSRTSSSLICSPASSTAVSRTTSMATTAAAASTPAAAAAAAENQATAAAAARAAGKIGAIITPSRQQQQQQQQQGHQVLGLSWDLMRQDNDKLRAIAACVGSQYACAVLQQQQQQQPGSPRKAPTHAAAAAAGRARPLVIVSVKSGILSSHLCAPAGLAAHVTAAAAAGRSTPPRQHPNGLATHHHHHHHQQQQQQQQQRTLNPEAAVASRSKPLDPTHKTLGSSPPNPYPGSPRSRSSLSGFMSQMLDQIRWPPDPWVVGEYPHRRSTSSGSAAMNHVAAAAVAAHPSRSLYVSGSSTGRIYLWQFGDTMCKAAYVPMTAAQLHTSPKRLALHEAVSTPHWGGPAALQFSRSGGRFGAVGDGGLVGLWRQDFISAVDGLGHAEWVGHCLSKAGTGITFLGDTGSQVLVSGINDRGGAVVLVDTLAPPLSPAAAQILSPKGVTPTALTLVPGGAGGSGAGPGAVLVVGEDSGNLSGFDVRVLAESRPLWTAKPHQEGRGSGGSSDNGVTCVTCWDPVMIGGISGILSADRDWGLGVSGGTSVSKSGFGPSWLGDLVVSGSRDGSIALVNAHTGTALQLMELAHYTERRGLLERVVGSRAGTGGGVSDDVTGPLLRARPAGAVGAAVTDVAACAEGLLSVGGDGVVKFHASAHVLNEWAGGEIY